MNSDHSVFGVYFEGKRYHQEGGGWSVYADRSDAEHFINKESEQKAYNDFQDRARSTVLNGESDSWNHVEQVNIKLKDVSDYLSKFTIIEFKPVNNQ